MFTNTATVTTHEPEGNAADNTDTAVVGIVTIGNPGLDGDVKALAYDNGLVYAGGAFTNYAAQWDGSNWTTMAGLDGVVNALVISGTAVYAGGAFLSSVDGQTHQLARWDGSAWQNMAGGDVTGAQINALAVNGNELYIGQRRGFQPCRLLGYSSR